MYQQLQKVILKLQFMVQLHHLEVCTPKSHTPIVQGDAIDGINTIAHRITVNSSGNVIASGSLFHCSTGTSDGGYGVLQSRRRARYCPGQGMVAVWSSIFDTPVDNSIQVSGIGHAESGVYFGYNGSNFGILHVEESIREIRTLTISTKSSTAQNATVTLNGTNYSIAVTNGATTATTAYELSTGSYSGWSVQQSGSMVMFLAGDAGARDGTYSITGSTLSGSFARTTAGSLGIQTWISQSNWNGDKLNGSGSSGITLNPQKGNIYQINLSMMFGAIEFAVQTDSVSGSNNSTFTTVHTIQNANTRTTPAFFNPTFPFTAAAYSAGSTTNLAVKTSCYHIAVAGHKKITGNRYTFWNTSTAVTNTGYTPLLTIRGDNVFNGRANQEVLNLLSMTAAVKHTQPVILFLLRNAKLTGANFNQNSSAGSSVSIDTSATAATISDNSQLVFSAPLGETGQFTFPFVDEITLQPGETLTVAGRTVTGTAAYVIASINIRED